MNLEDRKDSRCHCSTCELARRATELEQENAELKVRVVQLQEALDKQIADSLTRGN